MDYFPSNTQLEIEPILFLFWHVQFAGILFAVYRLLIGLRMSFGWNFLPGPSASAELLVAIWLLRFFLFPFG